jgi:hypothetical protein
VQVTSRNDVLLDNGAQFDMVVQTPLTLDATKVAKAVRQSRPPAVAPARSASMCRPIPATPGTPDTVIPGTPGTMATPDIVIPGANGMPPTVIPGTPATPGTSPTIISGTAGSPGIPCPAQPAVVSGPSEVQIHRLSFQVKDELTVSGMKLSPGSYEITWIGTDTTVQVELLRSGKTIVRAPARITSRAEKSPANRTVTRTNLDGSVSLASLEFASEDFAVVFD